LLRAAVDSKGLIRMRALISSKSKQCNIAPNCEQVALYLGQEPR